tara:strand:- start:399 stop:587 length:189 start_codon:yes stop_codon:yes gene_type:complete
MKVRFLKSIVGNGFHYRRDMVVDIHSDEIAMDYLNAGFCEAVAEPPKKRAKKAVKKSSKETR